MNDHEKKGPIAWMTKNSVVANILMIILLAGGIFSATQVKQEFLPDEINKNIFYKPGNNNRESKIKEWLKINWKNKYNY